MEDRAANWRTPGLSAGTESERYGVSRFGGSELDWEYLDVVAKRIAERHAGHASGLGLLV